MFSTFEVKTFEPTKKIKGQEELIIEGVPAKDILKNWRLKHHAVMFRRSKFVKHPEDLHKHLKALRGQDTCWMNPAMFEEFCTMDPELEKLAKSGNVEKVKERVEKIFIDDYLGVVIEKFKHIIPDLATYFAAKAAYGGLFAKDRKKIKNGQEGEVETTEVCHLADCWTVRSPQESI